MKKKTKRILSYLLVLSLIFGNFMGTGRIQAEAETTEEGSGEEGETTTPGGGATEPGTPGAVATATPSPTPTASPSPTPTPKDITVTVSLDGWTYGNTDAHTPSIRVMDSDNNEIADGKITYTYYTNETCNKMTTTENGAERKGKVPKNAGNYWVKAEVAGNDSYNAGSGIAAFTISKRTVTLTWGQKKLIYNGELRTITANVGNLVGEDKVELQYEGNTGTEPKSYTAMVTSLSNENYKLPEDGTNKIEWSINYLDSREIQITEEGTKGKDDWYTSEEVTLKASGYKFSFSKDKIPTNGSDWQDSLKVTGPGSHIIDYYLKQDSTDYITDKQGKTIKIDSKSPTGQIQIGDATWSEKSEDEGFKHFYKGKQTVTITAKDGNNESGVKQIEYCVSETKVTTLDNLPFIKTTNTNGNDNEKTTFTIEPAKKGYIYARITDNAGNQTIISSDSIVVYQDSKIEGDNSSISYTKTSDHDVAIPVSLNGNTIASIKNGEATLTADTNYTVEKGKIIFKSSYLSNLEAGEYTLKVFYHPCGETFTADSKGEAPAESTITLTVSKAGRSIKIDASKLSKEYDGIAVGKPEFMVTSASGTAIEVKTYTVEYRKAGTDNFVKTPPTDAGDYEVKVTVPADGDYNEASETGTFTISLANMKVTANASDCEYDGVGHGIQVSVSKPVKDYVIYYGASLQDLQNKKTSAIQYTDIGTYTVYYQVVAANYKDYTASATVSIRNRQIQQVPLYTEKNTYVVVGQTSHFKVDVQNNGGVNLEYQWYRNGQRISGSTAELFVKVSQKGRQEYTCDVLYKNSGKLIKNAGRWTVIGYETKLNVLYKKTASIKAAFGNEGTISKISVSKKNKKKVTVNAKKGTVKCKKYCKNVKLTMTMDNGQTLTVGVYTVYPAPKLKAKKGSLKSYVEGKYRTFYLKVSNVKGAGKVKLQYSSKKNKGFKVTKMKKLLVKKGAVYYIRAVAYYGKVRSPYSKVVKIKG